MKKLCSMFLVGLSAFLLMTLTVMAEGWDVFIDDTLVSNDEIKCMTIDDVRVIPVKSLAEYLGYEVTENENIITITETENCRNLRGRREEISVDLKNDVIRCTNKVSGESEITPISVDTIKKDFEKWLTIKLDNEIYVSPLTFGRMFDIVLSNNSFSEEKIKIYTRDYQHRMVIERGPTMLVNGEWIEFDAKPYIENNRVMIPFRAIAEAIEVKVEWDEENKKIIGYHDEKKYIEMTIGENKMLVDGKEIEIDVAPEIKDNRTYIPVRAFAESFGAEVRWSEANWNVGISIKKLFEKEEQSHWILNRMKISLPGEWNKVEEGFWEIPETYGCGMKIRVSELYKKSCGDLDKDLENLGIKATGKIIKCKNADENRPVRAIPIENVKENDEIKMNYLLIDNDDIFTKLEIVLNENKYQQYKGQYDILIENALNSITLGDIRITDLNYTNYDSDFLKYSWNSVSNSVKMYEIVSTEEKDGGIILDIKWDEESLANDENINSNSELITKTDSTFLNLDFTWNVYKNGEMKALVKDRGGCPVYLLEAYVPEGKNRKEIIKLVELLQIGRGSGAKPVIYLYPEKEQEIEVKLDLEGEFTFTYPEYNNGWKVTAKPDGTVISDGEEYSYLFWEGDMSNFKPDFKEGFVVKGSDSAEFLRNTLSKMGLTPKEYNEFIVYWAPILQENEYNKIYFAKEEYERSARLTITPEPDSVLRVYMVYEEADGNEVLPEQEIIPFERKGFTVVEWGGHLVE